jgi:plastocyanin
MPSSCGPRSSSRSALGALVVALGALSAGGATGAAAPAAATHTVVIEAVVFQPRILTVHVGDTVVWRNQDPFPHTATSTAFDSGPIAAGASWTYRTRQPGELAYVCTLHPTMKAVLHVE